MTALPDPTATVPQPTLRPRADGECELLLIRHGRSADVVPGSDEAADPPLHDLGRAQAAALADRLAAVDIDAVYSSHLRRAYETALPIATPRGLPVEVRTDLEEVRLGDWGRGEFRRRAAVGDPEFVAWARTGRWDGIPGGEGDQALRARVARVMDELVAQHRGGRLAVVSHGGAINAYLAHLLGLERSIWVTVENTSVTVVRVGPDGPTVVTVNDCHHLYDTIVGSPH